MEASSGEAAADVGAVLLRTTFFTREQDDFGPEREYLRDYADAISTVARFLEASFALAEWDDLGENLDARERLSIARRRADSVEIVSISMNTPFHIVLKFPAKVIEHIAESLLTIGEGICTFPARVGESRAKKKLGKAVADRQRTLVEQGRADGLILGIQIGTPDQRAIKADHMDYIDADATEEPLVELPPQKA
jgi:hypothetical protein